MQRAFRCPECSAVTIAPLHVFPICPKCGFTRRGEPRVHVDSPVNPPEEVWSHVPGEATASGAGPDGPGAEATTFTAEGDEAWPTEDAPGTTAWSDPSAVDEEEAPVARARFPMAALAALGVAIAGGMAWAALIRFWELEWGWLAAIIGAGCGFAAYWAAGRRRSPAVTAFAIACIPLAMLMGTYLGHYWLGAAEVPDAPGPFSAEYSKLFFQNLGEVFGWIHLVFLAVGVVAVLGTTGYGRKTQA